MFSNTRLKVVRGEDESFVLKLRTKTDKDPMDLTDATKITVVILKSNRSELILTNEEVAATKAKAKISGVDFIAANAGTSGNDIQLDFDGIRTTQQIVDDWNTANATNAVEHTGVSSQVLVGGIYRLSGGLPAYTPIEIQGNPVLGKIKVKLIDYHTSQLRLGLNQNLTVIIDFGVHPVGDRVVAQLKNFLDVVEVIS
jgi:hypothetical protein